MTTIGGKQFINRGTSQNPIYQRAGSSASIVSGGTAIDGANVSTGTDAPESPADGDLWFNESVGSLFVYIDGTGWVESNPGGGSGGGGTGGIFSTGYVNTDETTTVSYNATLTFTHNLGTTDLVYAIHWAEDSDGTDAATVMQNAGSHGVSIFDVTDTQFSILIGYSTQWAGKYIKVVAIAGGGGGGASVTTSETAPTSPSSGDLWYDTSVSQLYTYVDDTGWLQSNGGSSGPRAYLTANAFYGYMGGSATGNTIITSHNISSITYGTPNTYYINFENPVTDPVVQVSHGVISDETYSTADGKSFCAIQLFTDTSATWSTGQKSSSTWSFIVGGDIVRIGVKITQDSGLYKRVSPLFVTVH